MKKLFNLTLCVLTYINTAFAQVSVTVTNPGNATPGLLATYPSLHAALTDLNSVTSISGPIILTCAAGTETAPAGGFVLLNLTGTAINTITLQTSGTVILQAAPSPVAGSRTDAVLKIIGGDYITVNGFMIREHPLNLTAGPVGIQQMTEFGIALFPASPTNGASHNTIQNNTIQLGNGAVTYQNATGIFSTSASTAANFNQAATTPAGTNSDNHYYSNTITGVANGIYLISPPQTASVQETGTDIGGNVPATGNTITFGVATSAPDLDFNYYAINNVSGIHFRNMTGNVVRYNTISTAGTTSLLCAGIYSSYATAPTIWPAPITFSNNTITLSSTATNSGIETATGIEFGTGSATAQFEANYNTIVLNQTTSTLAQNCKITGINAIYTHNSCNTSYNKITINQSTSGSAANASQLVGIHIGQGTTANIFGDTITIGQMTSATVANVSRLHGVYAPLTIANLTFDGNVITFGQEVTGSGTYQNANVGGANFIDLSSGSQTHDYITIINNTFKTSGAGIRTGAGIYMIRMNSGTVTMLNTIKNNTADIRYIPTSGSVSFYNQSSTAPSTPADSLSNNTINIYTEATGSVFGISQMSGPSTPAAHNKSICNNTINVTGPGYASLSAIYYGGATGSYVIGNTINVNGGAVLVNAIYATGTIDPAFPNIIQNNTITVSSNAAPASQFVGVSASNNFIISNNTIKNIHFTGQLTGSLSLNGIEIRGQSVVFNNEISNVTAGAPGSTGNAFFTGISTTGNASTHTIYKNKIHTITAGTTTGTTLLNGIRISSGSPTAFNNLIGNITAPSASGTDVIRGISVLSTTTNSLIQIYHNTVYLNASSSATNFGTSGIYHTANTIRTTGRLLLKNNIFVNTSVASGTGITAAFRRSSGNTGMLANYDTLSNHNLFYAGTPGAKNVIYTDGTTSVETYALYATGNFNAGIVAPRDSASVTDNPLWLSTNGASADFLHINGSVVSACESRGALISSVVEDYDSESRINYPHSGQVNGGGTAPDIGADEFDGIYNPLPVVLLSFTAQKNNRGVDLKWITASEFNSAFFDLQRSADGVLFETITLVKTKGTTANQTSYFYTDATAEHYAHAQNSGIVYYRLIQHDLDGRVERGPVVSVKMEIQSIRFSIYPNPVTESCFLESDFLLETPATIIITDLSGKQILKKEVQIAAGKQQQTIPEVSAIKDGVYIIQLITTDDISVVKMIKAE